MRQKVIDKKSKKTLENVFNTFQLRRQRNAQIRLVGNT